MSDNMDQSWNDSGKALPAVAPAPLMFLSPAPVTKSDVTLMLISKMGVTYEQVDKFIAERKNLVIEGVDDQTAYDNVAEKAKELQKMRTTLDGKRKEMKQPLNELDAWVRVPVGALKDAEDELRAKLKAIDDEREQVVAQQRLQEQQRYERRCNTIMQLGMVLNPVTMVWSLEEATITDAIVRNSDSEVLSTLVKTRVMPIVERIAAEKERVRIALEKQQQEEAEKAQQQQATETERTQLSNVRRDKLIAAGAQLGVFANNVFIGEEALSVEHLWMMKEEEYDGYLAKLMRPKKTEIVAEINIDNLLDQHNADTEGKPEVLNNAERHDLGICSQLEDHMLTLRSLFNSMRTERGKQANRVIQEKIGYMENYIKGLKKEFQ